MEKELGMDRTLHRLLTEHSLPISSGGSSCSNDEDVDDSAGDIGLDQLAEMNSDWLETDILHGKALTLESLLEDQPEELIFGLGKANDDDDDDEAHDIMDLSHLNGAIDSNTNNNNHNNNHNHINNHNHDGSHYHSKINENVMKRALDDHINDLLDNKKIKIEDKIAYESILTPVSLSPSSTDGVENNTNTNSNNNNNNNVKASSSPDYKHKHNENDNKIAKPNYKHGLALPITKHILKEKIQTPISQVQTVVLPVQERPIEKFTNEFTMKQVFEMKQRMINTHKLMLNFNLLKDSYSKTCIELKKSLVLLKDIEISRSHLIVENEQLKLELKALKQKNQVPNLTSD
ncbi:hypothetical protein Kpol_1024p15 [Vanderwaltozyma polyspora DSM 70294]|uniref:Protein ATC1/LIC4 n=1 Tax=Vanderwaltozyma polyspora (strain ATCC 22028 / DSM 70294 / BCRC 21397 / CBS 2163 / NBRC 10782 / NRRL Y-8283 / UCD 57-17) TaxID=436907 RepID=A7TLH6_VANPO|nr:uncharacterized protein Kpol_1024p15 [Vanderwaltozyma polyspora DSM 70294]EDO16862.1 hypothetical protein Kpol_1024p15 [Vanderwaltozyma polyspora DSM 70294]